jgi:hypothetical protein
MPPKAPFPRNLGGGVFSAGPAGPRPRSGHQPVPAPRPDGISPRANEFSGRHQRYRRPAAIRPRQFSLCRSGHQRDPAGRNRAGRHCRLPPVAGQEPKSAPAHYYLAATLGELAQAEAPSIAAYLRVYEVEREFKTAAELDVRLDHAGPARTLGELYFQAPGWPLSIGSKDLAREWLERAAALAPGVS